MELIRNATTRTLLRNEINKLDREFKDYFQPHTLSSLENELKSLNQHRRLIVKSIKNNAKPIFLTSYVGWISLVDLGANLVYPGFRRKLLPKNWLRGKRDANQLFGDFVLSTSNQVLAVIYLCEMGLEWPARVLLRSVKELLNIGITLVADPETMNKYLALPPVNDKKDWYAYFSRTKISAKLADLSREFGLPEKDISKWVSFETKDYSFLSKHAHGSFLPTMLGAYYAPIDDPTRLRYSFYGGASVGIHTTLAGLNWEINYFNLMLWRILFNRYKFRFIRKKDRWESIFALSKIHGSLYDTTRPRRSQRAR